MKNKIGSLIELDQVFRVFVLVGVGFFLGGVVTFLLLLLFFHMVVFFSHDEI
jgi:hypothetical protein